ncbi:Hypothetical protein SCF082_LOCUS31420 [Durusdinium trenchii]|uniref:Uncharacterized protein n=1 Tax=Durusdinium trenchii TaxID=1381693 RepID=A0ABP0N675_9DINO
MDPEDAAEDESSAAWLEDLTARAGSSGDLRAAFALKPCSTKEIRQLGDQAFLGGKRTPGALPIYDLDGKVSLKFLLAAYKASEKSRDRLRGEDSEVDFHRPFLWWLLKKARELQLLSSREVKRGSLAPGRVDAAQKSGQWSLSLEQNQAEASDEEGRQKKALARARVQDANSMQMDVHFRELKPSEGTAKRKRTAGGSSDHEDLADDESSAAWLEDLTARAGSSGDLRAAFALKPCSTKEIRQLGDQAFLGGKRTPGALPIYDLDGKVSLKFLLATNKASEKSRDRLRGEDSEVDFHRPFIRWLLKKARELQLLSSREVSRGSLAPGRVDAAQKSGQWSLSLEQNQAEASDEEGRQKKALARARVQDAKTMQMDVRFPTRKSSEGSNEDAAELLKQQWRSQLEPKKDKIEANSSHGLDLQKMCDRLTAPSLSFDWEEPESDEDESKGILQVELPASAKTSEGRRALLREEIKRSLSFKQAKELTKVKSLPSSGDFVRAAATPTKAKKRKVGPQIATEPDLPSSTPKEEASSEVQPAQEAGLSSDAVTDPPKPSASSSDMSPTGPDGSGSQPQEVQPMKSEPAAQPSPERLVAKGVAGVDEAPPFALEISPTLPFEPVEGPRDEEPKDPDPGCDISPTLPFDIDASALQEACNTAPAVAEEPAMQTEEVVAEAPAPMEEEPEVPSSEDEEMKGNARALRERAWLRHKRNMQAVTLSQEVTSQEDLSFGRPKRTGPKKRSILMGSVAACC